MSRIKHPRKHLFWLGTASVAVVLVLAMLLLNGTLAPRAVDAAPPVQSSPDLCALLLSLVPGNVYSNRTSRGG